MKQSYSGEMLDVACTVLEKVEVLIGHGTMWVHVDGRTVLRASRYKEVEVLGYGEEPVPLSKRMFSYANGDAIPFLEAVKQFNMYGDLMDHLAGMALKEQFKRDEGGYVTRVG